MTYVSLLPFLQALGLNTLMALPPNSFLNWATNSSNPGHINTLIANFHFGDRYFWYIRSVCSSNAKSLMASMSLSPMVLGAMSDMMRSVLPGTNQFALSISSILLVCVMSWTYVSTHGKLISASLMSKPTIWYGSIFWSLRALVTYWIRLPGEHPMSMMLLVSLFMILNLFCISSSLNADLALNHSFFACLK